MRQIKVSLLIILTLCIGLVACGEKEEKEVENQDLEEPTEIVEVPDVAEVPEETEEPIEVEQIVSDDERVDETELVLIVNGEEVYGDRYNLAYLEVKNRLVQAETLPEDLTEVHDEAMGELINHTLLAQDAKDKGIVVTSREEDEIFEDTKAQFESEAEFYQILDQLPYTEDVFREILAKSLLQQLYITQEFTDIAISDDDIEEFYDILADQLENPPALEEIRTDIHNQLLQTEIQMALTDRINQLKKVAEIEVILEK